VSQGGAFPDHAEREAFDLLNLALRMGVEYIDVEISWPEKRIRDLSSRKGASQIIASWHDWSGKMKWNGARRTLPHMYFVTKINYIMYYSCTWSGKAPVRLADLVGSGGAEMVWYGLVIS